MTYDTETHVTKREMPFRFRVSQNFSITGQLIERLIKGDVPQDHAERVELFTSVLDKFQSVSRGHEAARQAAIASQEGGPGFLLYLRNFGTEGYETGEPGIERIYDNRAAELVKSIRAQAADASMPMLSLRGGGDALSEFYGFSLPFFTGELDNWERIATELISAAKVIVIVASEMTPGLLEEVDLVRAQAKRDRTVVFVRDSPKALADLINRPTDPERIAGVKAEFADFRNVFGPPPAADWRPGVHEVNPAFIGWPGTICLGELLRDGYKGTSDLDMVRTAPYQIVSPSDLQTTEHVKARADMERILLALREGIRSLHLDRPLDKSVASDAADSNHQRLGAAHIVFGIAAALEEYAVMIESLALMAETHTYLLHDPGGGHAFAGFGFEVLRLRGAESFYAGLEPESQPLGTLAREELGNLYYALGRLYRDRGQPADARSAYLAAIAVRGGLPSPSAQMGTAAALHSLGGLLHAQGRHHEAKEVMEQAIAIRAQVDAGRASERLGASYHNLGSILIALGDFEGATNALFSALNLKKEALRTVRSVSVAETSLLYASVYLKSGRIEEVLPLLRHSRDTLRELAPDHPALPDLDRLVGPSDGAET